MADIADLLMMSGVVRVCPDCHDERILVPTDIDVEFCCTSCGAAVLIDPSFDRPEPEHAVRVA